MHTKCPAKHDRKRFQRVNFVTQKEFTKRHLHMATMIDSKTTCLTCFDPYYHIKRQTRCFERKRRFNCKTVREPIKWVCKDRREVYLCPDISKARRLPIINWMIIIIEFGVLDMVNGFRDIIA